MKIQQLKFAGINIFYREVGSLTHTHTHTPTKSERERKKEILSSLPLLVLQHLHVHEPCQNIIDWMCQCWCMCVSSEVAVVCLRWSMCLYLCVCLCVYTHFLLGFSIGKGLGLAWIGKSYDLGKGLCPAVHNEWKLIQCPKKDSQDVFKREDHATLDWSSVTRHKEGMCKHTTALWSTCLTSNCCSPAL